MSKINITASERLALIEAIHQNAVAKGFWAEDHSEQHYLMLVITELSEAVEADRKGRRADRSAYEDAIKHCVPAGAHSPAHFERDIKDSVEDELADALIRLYDMVGAYKYRLLDTMIAKERNRAIDDFVWDESEFTAQVLRCISPMFRDGSRYKVYDYVIAAIEAVAEYNDIDLYWHVREKMKYNATRPPLHGKKY